MIIEEVREIIKGMELSEEAGKRIDELLEGIEAGGEVSDELVDKILTIVDIEIDGAKLTKDIYEGGAAVAEEFLKEVDTQAGLIADKLEQPSDKPE